MNFLQKLKATESSEQSVRTKCSNSEQSVRYSWMNIFGWNWKYTIWFWKDFLWSSSGFHSSTTSVSNIYKWYASSSKIKFTFMIHVLCTNQKALWKHSHKKQENFPFLMISLGIEKKKKIKRQWILRKYVWLVCW